MNKQSQIRALVVLVFSIVSLAACNGDDDDSADPVESRGSFGASACPASERVDVPGTAVGAIYIDKDGDAVGPIGEDLKGTDDKRMCPTPPPGGGGVCNKPGYCPRLYKGTTICLPCT